MPALRRLTSAAARRAWWLGLKFAWLIATLALAIILGFTLYAVSMLPPLQPWHTERLHEEFSALRHGDLDFAGYLQREEKLFAELRETVAKWDSRDEAYLHSRFNPAGAINRLADGAPYNRSFRLTQREPKGQALLIHGLTDSPYSMKALAESLHARGFEVTVLRLPGHGTLPSMMTEMRTRDWTAAVRIAARDVAARASGGQPFYIGGYSTGGTLSLQYTLDALEDKSLRRPDRVLLVSPAIELTKVAAAGRDHRRSQHRAGPGAGEGPLAGDHAGIRPVQVQLLPGQRLASGQPRHQGAAGGAGAGARIGAPGADAAGGHLAVRGRFDGRLGRRRRPALCEPRRRRPPARPVRCQPREATGQRATPASAAR